MLSLPRLLRIAVVITSLAAVTDCFAAPLTIEQLMDIRHPSEPVWSPDGKHIAYLWDRCDVVNLFVVDTQGETAPRAVTHLTSGKVEGAFWSHDGGSVYFQHDGKLWRAPLGGGDPQAAWTMPAGTDGVVPSHDGSVVAASIPQSGGGRALVLHSLADNSTQTIAENNGAVFSIVWSPDDQHLSFVGDGKLIPHDLAPSYSGEKLIFRTMEYGSGRIYVTSRSRGAAKPVTEAGSWYEGAAWVGNKQLVYERPSSDFKDRSIVVVDADSGAQHVLHTDHEPNFWSLPEDYAGGGPLPSPDGKWIAWISDTADGWDHIYISPAQGGQPIELTTGHGESWRPVWSHDSRSLAFDVNSQDHPGNRRVAVVSVADGATHPAVHYVTEEEGASTDPRWSPADDALVFQRTDWQHSADLFVAASTGTAEPRRLTDSMPHDLDKSLLVRPKYVTFPGADGTPVPGWLFVPKGLDETRKHPAIVWIHGDGINQNYDGWHIQRNYAVYYSFHQYLLQQGYVVFAPDYRGSIGYGAKWRSAVFMDVGGKDAEDASRAGDYLATLPYVDKDRMGVWGLSYGGFFTLIAATRHPTLFRSAVDVAGVADYAMYYEDPYHGDWTASRIGTPEQNPQVYANASPLAHIGELQRPLLILHGTADVNVPFLESVRLVDEALKQKKGDLITFMMYPGEFHYFSREQVLSDAWHRVDQFFGKTLKSDSR